MIDIKAPIVKRKTKNINVDNVIRSTAGDRCDADDFRVSLEATKNHEIKAGGIQLLAKFP